MENLVFPAHALAAMRRDGLTEDDVYVVVGDCDELIERIDRRTVYSRMLDDGRHATIVVEDDEVTVVIAWVDARRSRRVRR